MGIRSPPSASNERWMPADDPTVRQKKDPRFPPEGPRTKTSSNQLRENKERRRPPIVHRSNRLEQAGQISRTAPMRRVYAKWADGGAEPGKSFSSNVTSRAHSRPFSVRALTAQTFITAVFGRDQRL